MDKFLSMREDLYQLRHGGLESIPLLTIFGKDSRRKQFHRKLKQLKVFVKSSKIHPSNRKRMNQILALDVATDFSPKNSGYGMSGDFYTTGFGVKIDKSCFNVLEKTSRLTSPSGQQGSSRDRVLGLFSGELNRVGLSHVDKVLGDKVNIIINQIQQCGENYPALKGFTKEWLKTLKRTKVYCKDELSSEIQLGGYAIPDYVPPLMDKKLYLPSDSFLKFFLEPAHKSKSYTDAKNILIHEIFHLTHSDNRPVWVHNETNQPNLAFNCSDNDRLTDRIYLMSSLCTGYKVVDKNPNDSSGFRKYMFDELMTMKVKMCGMEKGCVRHFSNLMESSSKAKRFCENIVNMGKCRSNFNKANVQFSQSFKSGLRKLYQKFRAFEKKCFDSSISEAHKPRKTGCPSSRYLSMSSNLTLGNLMSLFHYNPQPAHLINADTLKYLREHPYTSRFLSPTEWGNVIDGIEPLTDEGITKHCAERFQIYKTIKGISIPKVEECKMNR